MKKLLILFSFIFGLLAIIINSPFEEALMLALSLGFFILFLKKFLAFY